MQKEIIIQYLEDIVNLETSKRKAENLYNRLLIDEKNCKNMSTYTVQKQKIKVDKKKTVLSVLGIFFFFCILMQITKDNTSAVMMLIALFYIAVFGCLVWLWINARKKRNTAFELDKKQADQNARESAIRLPVIQKEKGQLNSVYQECTAELNRLYAIGIIHPNYRSFVPCAMFLQYLDTGRTHSLEATPGDKGAYNLYVEEVRFNIISSKLDSIRQNQELIYRKLQDIDETVDSLYGSVRQIQQYSKQIEQNTRISAWCDSITAYNTTTLRRRIDDYYRYRL